MKRTYFQVSALTGWIGSSIGFLLLCSLFDTGMPPGYGLTPGTIPLTVAVVLIILYAGFVIAGGIVSVVLVKYEVITVPEAFRYAFFSKHPKFWLRDQEKASS